MNGFAYFRMCALLELRWNQPPIEYWRDRIWLNDPVKNSDSE